MDNINSNEIIDESSENAEYTIARDVIINNRRNVKLSYKRKSFLQYFLGDLLGIKKFAQVVSLIKFRFFIFMSMNQNISEQYNQKIRSSARTLSQSLLPIINNGWRSLSKLTYNKIVYLYELTSLLKRLDRKVFLMAPDAILRSLQDIESAYLILSSDKNFLNSLQNELDHYYKIMKNQEFPVDFLIRNISTLLSTSSQTINLNTFLQALNILTYRSYCEMNMFINPNAGPFFYNTGFELDESNQTILSEFTQSLVDTIKQNLEIYQDINLVRQFISLRIGNEKNDMSLIEKFYDEVNSNKLSETIGSNNFIHDYNNVIAIMFHFSRKIEIACKTLLMGEFLIESNEDNKKVRIFEPSLFSNFLKRAAYIRSKLNAISNDIPVLRREFYISAVAEGRIMSESAELVAFISELTGIFFQMAKIIASVLHYSQRLPKSETLPAIHLVDFKNTRFFLPYSDHTQLSSYYLAGKTVRQALSHIAELLLTFCLDFREVQLMGTVAKEKNATQTLRHLVKELERMCNAEEFQKLKVELGIDSLQLV